MQLKKYWYYVLFILLFSLFCYFRLKPILLQTVPYTFDQGRDFLRTQSIVREGDIAVFGPPSGGPNGLSHGVWWYYELLIPYLLGGANPIAYYYFIFAITTISIVLFAHFLHREFNSITSLFFMAIVASAPYFILASFFPINSIMTIPFILLLYYAIYMFLKDKRPMYAMLIALSAAFILEAEVAFGLFLFPALLIIVLFTKNLRVLLSTKRYFKALLVGFIIPFMPRILAELVTKFRQTSALFRYFANSSEPIDKNANLFLERTKLFWEYYLSLFPDGTIILAQLALVVTIGGLIGVFWIKSKSTIPFIMVTLLLPSLLFALSLLSNKQLFWANYFEGIQYMLVMPLIMAIYVLSSSKYRLLKALSVCLLGIFIISPITLFARDISTQGPVPLEGLRRHAATIEAIRVESGNKPICLRIYTPPVIPHTYSYLLDYYERKGYTKPSSTFIKNECYYIFEKDQKGYEFRTKNWRNEHIPAKARRTFIQFINSEVSIERWQDLTIK